MKKIITILFFFITIQSLKAQEYIEVLRSADNTLLVNPALAGIDGRSSLSVLDTRSIRGTRFSSRLSYATASFRMTDNLIYCPTPGYFSSSSGTRSSRRITNNHFQTSIDLLSYGNSMFKRLSLGATLGYRQQLTREVNMMFALKTIISQDKFDLTAWDTSDPLYQNWVSNNFKQYLFALVPGFTIYSKNLLIGLSTKIGMFNEKKFQFQDGKFDPFGTATIGTVSYDVPVGELIISLGGNYVLISDEPNFYTFGLKTKITDYFALIGGSRDMVEVFAGVEVILDKTSIELYINNIIGDNVRSSVPIYSVRLKAFDLF